MSIIHNGCKCTQKKINYRSLCPKMWISTNYNLLETITLVGMNDESTNDFTIVIIVQLQYIYIYSMHKMCEQKGWVYEIHETYIFLIHKIENVFLVDLENCLLRWGESWKCIKGFEQLLHILLLSPFEFGERDKCISKQYQSWKLKIDETIQHFPCNKTNPTKGLDHGLTTNHFKDMGQCDD